MGNKNKHKDKHRHNDGHANAPMTSNPSNAATPTEDSQTQHLPEAPRTEASATQPKWKRSPEFYISVLGLFVGLGVLLIYYLQWREMVETVNVTRRVSERDQRAWMKVISLANPKPEANQPLSWQVRMQNIGKTPARNVVTYLFVDVLPKGSGPDLDYDKVRACMRTFKGVVYPEESGDFPAIRFKFIQKSTSEVEMYDLQPAELERILAGSSYVAVHGIIHYDDAFHAHHWEKFCVWWSPTAGSYSAAECAQNGNSTDDNDEP